MGSVLSSINCPDCGSEAMVDCYYKTGEEYINCQYCGYSREFTITNWDDKDKELVWTPLYKIVETHGKGAYKLRGKGAAATECGSFIVDNSEEEFIKLVQSQKELLEHAEYTTYRDGKFNTVVLIQGELENITNT